MLEGTKNALDFQLSSYLGYIIRENEDKPYNYYIVSKDKGFECIINFWKKKASVRLVFNVVKENEQGKEDDQPKEDAQAKEETQVKENEQAKEAEQAAEENAQVNKEEPAKESVQAEQDGFVQSVCQLINDPDDAVIVAKMIQKYKTKSGINNALMKAFPSKNNQKASKIYTAIKPLIADKKGR